MLELLRQPWPWYLTGFIVGLTVPILLILGNKNFGISANLRHVCAACAPARIPFFQYNWKKEAWNLFFAAGIILGAMLAAHWLADPSPVVVHPDLKRELAGYGITDFSGLVPKSLFSLESLMSIRGLVIMIGGGFLVGFGTRYAGGCTSGHSIMGLSNLQLPSLIATICFTVGGFIMANFILPHILSL